MSIEERLRSGIGDAVDRAPLGSGDVAVAESDGRRLRRRRQSAVVVGAGVVVALVAVSVAVVSGGDPDPVDPALPPSPAPAPVTAAGWTRAASGPLSPRYGPLMVGVGSRVLVLGGHSTAPCPPGADCIDPDDLLTDAAVYDVEADVWAEVSDPPVSVVGAGAVAADHVVVLGTDRDWVSYDPVGDTWESLPSPPVTSYGPEVALDGLVYARTADRARDVLVLDLASRSWSTIPADPLVPRLTDTSLFATDAGVVLAGVNYDEAAPDEPTLQQADVWDGSTWRRLPPTGQIGPFYHWTGSHLVGLERGSADGGAVNGWDRAYPFGGRLDPVSGAWSPVSGLPSSFGSVDGAWSVEAAAGPWMAASGFVYDDVVGVVAELGRPGSPVDTELAGAWADGRLVVFGGYDEDRRSSGAAALSSETWVWTPGSPSSPSSSPSTSVVEEGDPAVWTLPRASRPDPTTTSLEVDVSRLGCNSGVTGRVLAPVVDYRATEVIVTFEVEADSDGGRCQGNDAVPWRLVLDQPLGDRALVDGACLIDGAATGTSHCQPYNGVRFEPA